MVEVTINDKKEKTTKKEEEFWNDPYGDIQKISWSLFLASRTTDDDGEPLAHPLLSVKIKGGKNEIKIVSEDGKQETVYSTAAEEMELLLKKLAYRS